jgi:hypothetical protein
MLEPVERALAREGSTVLALGLEFAGERRQHRVVPELVVVDQILVPERAAVGTGCREGSNRRRAPI